MNDRLNALRKKEKDEIARLDAACIKRANHHLDAAWEALSAYFLRHPLRENEASELSMALSSVEDAIKRMARVA